MQAASNREVWQRGPVADVPALLQPAAHALLQVKEEVEHLMQDFPDALLWQQPAGVASPAFHLQHMAGVIDRLFTYANGSQLSQPQLQRLKAEGKADSALTVAALVQNLATMIEWAITQLSAVDESMLTEPRGIGRAQIPTNVIGLLFHAAEHSMRHTGQLMVTVKLPKAQYTP